ncbi:hypothetical protein [Altericista sp. CCNU0014]|uniref:hypothetical protein n=1 Tax=Altericista sp. CCNU0014 TaxID=3082949 RepID=UPI00384E52AF
MKLIPLSLISIGLTGTALLPFALTPPQASAQCIQSHAGIQLKLGEPAAQTNNVRQTGDGPCSGNVQSSTSVQVDRNPGRGRSQHQEVDQRLEGGRGNGTGVNGPTVRNSVVVDVNVRTPKKFKP